MLTQTAGTVSAHNLETIGKYTEGVWLPIQETHLLEWMTKNRRAFRKNNVITYQWKKQKATMQAADKYLPKWREGIFVDIGGHVGLWSMWWAQQVTTVVAFEPVPSFRILYAANMQSNSNWTLIPLALADVKGSIDLRIDPHNSGSTRAYAKGEHHDVGTITVDVDLLDNVMQNFTQNAPVTVIKIDCEGYEEKVLAGGEETITKHRPIIIVEQKQETKHFGFTRKGAVLLLETFGYVSVRELSGDHIMVPKERL